MVYSGQLTATTLDNRDGGALCVSSGLDESDALESQAGKSVHGRENIESRSRREHLETPFPDATEKYYGMYSLWHDSDCSLTQHLWPSGTILSIAPAYVPLPPSRRV